MRKLTQAQLIAALDPLVEHLHRGEGARIRQVREGAEMSSADECGLCGGPTPCLTHRQGLPASQLSAVRAEPVAWRWRYTSETLWRYRSGRPSFPTDGAGVQCEPLYDRPAPDAQPQTAPSGRKALHEIKKLALSIQPSEVPERLAHIVRLCIDAGAASPAQRNWTEDAPHENGNYECRCGDCDQSFIGHKRRVVCKACAAMNDAARSQADIAEDDGPLKFADYVENIAASFDNPIKYGRFVRIVNRTGRLNAGKFVEYIDDRGETHLTPPDNIRRRDRTALSRPQCGGD